MSAQVSDREQLRSKKHFFDELETGIRIANQEIIGACVPDLNKKKIHAFAVLVSRLRASYIALAFKMCTSGEDGEPDPALIESLRTRREMFEEARDAYEALRRAIERGYIEVHGVEG